MNIVIWNPRGLNGPGRVLSVNEFMCKHRPDIIALSETKKEDFSPACLKSIANFHIFEWTWLPAKGTAGGILVGVNLDMFDIFLGIKENIM